MAKVSIIIPFYNIEKHIKKCVDSILCQTFTDFELLLINDGSTDQTLPILREYEKQDRRVKIFTHPNRGVSYTRNRGIELAVSDYIMFIDGDDYVKTDFLEEHLKYAAPGVWPISGMVYVKNEVIENSIYFEKLLEFFPDHQISKEMILKVLQYYSLSSPCSRVYSKRIVDDYQIKFNENVSYQEDLLFNLEYIEYINYVQLIDYYGYYYVQHNNSSSLKYHDNFNYSLELFDKIVKMIRNQDDKKIVDEFIFHTYMKKISNIFHNDAPYTKSQISFELKNIFNDNYFNSIRFYILKSPINLLLKTLLYFKKRDLLYYYFKIRK